MPEYKDLYAIGSEFPIARAVVSVSRPEVRCACGSEVLEVRNGIIHHALVGERLHTAIGCSRPKELSYAAFGEPKVEDEFTSTVDCGCGLRHVCGRSNEG